MKKISQKTIVLMSFLLFLTTIFVIIIDILMLTNLIIVHTIGKYFTNALAAFLLVFSLYILITRYKIIKKEVVNYLSRNKFTRKMVKEYDFRTAMFSLISLSFNLCLLAYYLGFTIFNFNFWFLSLTIYYSLLFFAREITLYNLYRHPNNYLKKIKVAKTCGILLCLLPLYLYLAVRELINNNNFNFPQIHVITMAVVTFYKVIMGIYNSRKAHKTNDIVVISLRNINLAEALVSLLALEAAMFTAFNDNHNIIFERTMLVSTGLVVTTLTLFIGINMIVRTIKEKNSVIIGGNYELEDIYREREE